MGMVFERTGMRGLSAMFKGDTGIQKGLPCLTGQRGPETEEEPLLWLPKPFLTFSLPACLGLREHDPCLNPSWKDRKRYFSKHPVPECPLRSGTHKSQHSLVSASGMFQSP